MSLLFFVFFGVCLGYQMESLTLHGILKEAQSGHATCILNGHVLIHGGRSGNHLFRTFSRYDPGWKSWTILPSTGGSYTRHSMSIVNNSIYLIGGRSYGYGFGLSSLFANLVSFSKIEKFSIDANSWATIHVSSPPPSRLEHSATVIGNEIWIFGGTDKSEYFADVHVLDVVNKTWRIPKLGGQPPKPRRGHTATLIDGDKIVIIGGSNEMEHFSDLHVLDTKLGMWVEANVQGTLPGRYGHGAVLLWGSIFIIGGNVDFGPTSDVFVLVRKSNALNFEYQSRSISGITAGGGGGGGGGGTPFPLYHFGSPLLIDQNETVAYIFILGGYNGKQPTKEVWVLKIQKPKSV
eukprot:TRINITY_DN5396_c0_g2_i11.p1 TRINITY_DN5396_c0_g2~~TRINITY_DN5396_c0_g2_i11.p1  ORF type:complete len:349 (-),score=58.95 TRINITY_DN5396_c0_g2_i11:756-1802(-)